MAPRRRRSRQILTATAALIAAAALAAAFWPRAMLVDIGTVTRGRMIVTVDEEARTRVRDPYVISSPIAGDLQRVELEPGDRVKAGDVVARMAPAAPAALDIRTREQARAAVDAAEAALRVARSDLKAAEARSRFAHSELDRISRLVERGIVSRVQLERAEQEAQVADAQLETVRAEIARREAEVNNALARLISFDDTGLAEAVAKDAVKIPTVPIRAPIDGTVLKVFHESATTLPAGEPILEIGDVAHDLEIVADLLSSDAVKVERGDRVIITNWGGDSDLEGVVSRIAPYGHTKHSALGVEEQRVETTIAFADPNGHRSRLGHGYRVEAHIVIWERDDAVMVPSSALFRHQGNWAVFAIRDGRAVRQRVRIGHNNGNWAELLDGLEPGDQVVLFPSARLTDGQRIRQRRIE
ncbi:efflux RND transporter periplasmic adaptor subunit [Jhaorihella thermophila]|uniref:HlyD family secretion protein n=1 Tax=Jhaorihella thermophila TaxID=488547 RepID=A0A1H5TI22_9RHOB|nr:HlyD family efflux transporter periplasmic adaptor subunit [Jhaorihella thermophila]SEF61657.1 HlyD family secretion protein [Jhaorihella thermophila]